MKRRILSMLLAVVLTVYLALPVFAQEEDPSASMDTSQVQVEGTTSVGKLMAQELSGEIAADNGASHIAELTLAENIASVEYATDRAADIVVGIYDETSGQMSASGTVSVGQGNGTASVTLEGEVPDGFYATAYLLDCSTHEPLCEEYTTELYTSEMQEFLGNTIEDFDEERLVNLDENPATNFMVYDDETVVVESSTETNVITDNGDGTYTVKNADSTFTSLKVGDVVSYEYGDESMLLIKVAAISVEGTTVTLTESSDVSLADFFAYVKVDVGSISDNGDVAPAAWEADVKTSEKLELALEEKYSDNVKLKITGSVSVSISIKIYISHLSEYIEFKTKNTIEGAVSVSGKIELPKEGQPIDPIMFNPVFGLYVGVEPKLIFSASGKLDFSIKIEQTFGFALDNGKFINKSTDPKASADLKAEGKIEFGLAVKPYIYFIHKNVLDASIELGAKGTLTASMTFITTEETHHDCEDCIKGDIKVSSYLTAKVKLFKHIKYENKILDISVKVCDFYYSLTFHEFGLGTCPHISYKVSLTVKGEKGLPLPQATVEGTDLPEAPVTDVSGVATFYLPNGEYSLSIMYDHLPKEINVKVDGRTVEMDVVFFTSVPEVTPEPGEGEIIASGECGAYGDNVRWYLTDGGTLTIYGKGKMADYDYTNVAPWYSSREIQCVVIKDGVTEIGSNAFSGTSLTLISIPDSVTVIGDGAFSWCTNLTSISIPDGVTVISVGAFSDCTSLASISIPDSVTWIGSGAFFECIGLTSISIPDSVTVIGQGTFSECTGLTSISVPDSVTVISVSAFFGCSSLISISIPDSVTEIGANAFSGCSSLTSISIPDSVTVIGDRAFSGCSSLTSISIPDSVTVISEGTFSECTGLTSISIPNNVTEIGDAAFELCTNLTSINIPDNVTVISESLFFGCSSLISISIPDSVTEIGANAFSGCSSLVSVSIPDNVTVIGAYAFYYCTSLASISIPDSVTGIGDWAFQGCDILANIYYSGSQEQWSLVTMADGNDALTNAYIHYNSTGPENVGMASEPTATAEPEATAEPTMEPMPVLPVEPTPEATAEPTPESTPEPTPEPSPEPVTEVEVPEMPEAPAETGVEPVRASQQMPTGDVELVAEFESSGTGQTALFSGLRPDADYVVLVVLDASASDLLAPGNLLYISQTAADSSGNIAMAYAPRTDAPAQVRAYGPERDQNGDVNRDGHIDLKDVTRLYQHTHGGPAAEAVLGDVTGDGMITDADVQRLFQFVSGHIAVLR